MRINPYSNQSPIESVNTQPKAAKPSGAAASGVSATTESTDGFTRSTALSGLINALRELPDVRTDALEAVSAKLAAGELETQAAYAEAATNMVDAR